MADTIMEASNLIGGHMTKQIPLSKGKFALVDDADFDWLNQWKWCCNHYGYAVRSQHIGMKGGKQKLRLIFMHRLILDAPSGSQVDHKNMNRSDNRRENIRLATRSQNQANRIMTAGKTSKYKGVSWDKSRNLWAVCLKKNGKKVYRGRFKNEEDAAVAYDNAALLHFKEFSKLNFQGL